MEDLIKQTLLASAAVKQTLAADAKLLKQIAQVATHLKRVTAKGGVIYACGNGGSCCDAMHFTEELTARYKRERPGFKALAFSDPGGITCWSNDYDYTSVFARYAETFCSEKDILFGFTTSGNSTNVLAAFQKAKEKGCLTVAMTGKDGGLAKDVADISIIVPSESTAHIQEAHIAIVHILCEIVER